MTHTPKAVIAGVLAILILAAPAAADRPRARLINGCKVVTLGSCTNANLAGANLAGLDLYGVHLPGANLTGANLHGTKLRHAELIGANLSHADLSHADLTLARLDNSNLGWAKLQATQLGHSHLTGASLTHADLSGAHVSSAVLTNANFDSAWLAHANLTNSHFSHTNFHQAHTGGTHFYPSNFASDSTAVNSLYVSVGAVLNATIGDCREGIVGARGYEADSSAPQGACHAFAKYAGSTGFTDGSRVQWAWKGNDALRALTVTAQSISLPGGGHGHMTGHASGNWGSFSVDSTAGLGGHGATHHATHAGGPGGPILLTLTRVNRGFADGNKYSGDALPGGASFGYVMDLRGWLPRHPPVQAGGTRTR